MLTPGLKRKVYRLLSLLRFYVDCDDFVFVSFDVSRMAV